MRAFVSWSVFAFSVASIDTQTSLFAATQDVASVAQQLSANDPMAVAWGGYLAGEHRVQDAIPHLIAALDSSRLQQAGREWKAARFAVLDALILLGAQPSPDVLLRYYPEHREQVLILLSVPRPGRDEVLLRLLKNESGIPWYAIAGLLLETKAPGLAAALIDGLRLRLEVSVVDGRPHSSGGVGGGCVRLPLTASTRPRDFHRLRHTVCGTAPCEAEQSWPKRRTLSTTRGGYRRRIGYREAESAFLSVPRSEGTPRVPQRAAPTLVARRGC